MKRITLVFLPFLLITLVVVVWKYPNSKKQETQPVQELTTPISIKDCGSSRSAKGNNSDNMDKQCFLESYSACTPAKLFQEVIDPNNNPIKTSVFIDTKEDGKCRVSVHVEHKMSFPENDIYYCYSVTQGGLDNYHLKIDDCKERKALFL